MRESLKPLYRIIGDSYTYYPLITLYSIGIGILTLATPISVQSLVSTLSFGALYQPIIILSATLFGLLALLGITKSVQYLLVEYLQRMIYAKSTVVVGEAMINSESQGVKFNTNRYFDILLIYKNLAFLVTDGITFVLQTILGLVLISFYHPFFLAYSFLVFAIILIPVITLSKPAMTSSVDESSKKYQVADFLAHIQEKKRSGHFTDSALKRDLDCEIASFLSYRRRHFRILFTQNVMYAVIYAIMNAILLALGGYLIMRSQLSVGQLVAAEIVVNAILGQLLYFKKYLESFYDMYAATHKLYPFYNVLDKIENLMSKEEKERDLLLISTCLFRLFTTLLI